MLQVGAVTEQVSVRANAAMVDTQSGTLKQIVTTRYLEDLPLNGRNAATRFPATTMWPGMANILSRPCSTITVTPWVRIGLPSSSPAASLLASTAISGWTRRTWLKNSSTGSSNSFVIETAIDVL